MSLTLAALENLALTNNGKKCQYPVRYEFEALTKADKKRVKQGNVVDRAGLFWHIANNAGFVPEYEFRDNATIVMIKGER